MEVVLECSAQHLEYFLLMEMEQYYIVARLYIVGRYWRWIWGHF